MQSYSTRYFCLINTTNRGSKFAEQCPPSQKNFVLDLTHNAYVAEFSRMIRSIPFTIKYPPDSVSSSPCLISPILSSDSKAGVTSYHNREAAYFNYVLMYRMITARSNYLMTNCGHEIATIGFPVSLHSPGNVQAQIGFLKTSIPPDFLRLF